MNAVIIAIIILLEYTEKNKVKRGSKVKIMPLNNEYLQQAVNLLNDEWGATRVATRGTLHDCAYLPAYIALEGDELAGLITYNVSGSECEIITLNSLIENNGIAWALIEKVIESAKEKGCSRLIVITTNDNTKAIRYYQKRGFSLKAVRINAVNESRKLKPEIPLTGNDGIPILHEFEFEIII